MANGEWRMAGRKSHAETCRAKQSRPRSPNPESRILANGPHPGPLPKGEGEWGRARGAVIYGAGRSAGLQTGPGSADAPVGVEIINADEGVGAPGKARANRKKSLPGPDVPAV